MERARILIVDDMPANIRILKELLKDDYRIAAARSGFEALSVILGDELPDLVLLDVMMPGMDGYEVCARMKADPRTAGIPVLFVTAMGEAEDEERGLRAGGVDYIVKPISPAVVKARVANHVELKRHRDHLSDLVALRTRELAETQDVTFQCLASLAETRDNETGGHILRTQRYVAALVELMRERGICSRELCGEAAERMVKSAPLHDIGKVGVPDAVLLKPGRLTDEEFALMKEHTRHGRDAIAKAEERLSSGAVTAFLVCAREMAYSHHEKWDGSGYPEGLSGSDIPLAGRLMAVADVYDALVTKRVYKPPFSHGKALSIMREGRGTHFDPQVLDIFLEISESFREIAIAFADYEEEREALREG